MEQNAINAVLAALLLAIVGACDRVYSSVTIDQLKPLLLDATVNDSKFVEVVKLLDNHPLQAGETAMWAKLANSANQPASRRLTAIFQLFGRCIRMKSTVASAAHNLSAPIWLKPGCVRDFTTLMGKLPLERIKGQTIYAIYPQVLQDDFSGIYIRVTDHPSADDVYIALTGHTSTASQCVITAIAINCDEKPNSDIIIPLTRDIYARG